MDQALEDENLVFKVIRYIQCQQSRAKKMALGIRVIESGIPNHSLLISGQSTLQQYIRTWCSRWYRERVSLMLEVIATYYSGFMVTSSKSTAIWKYQG